MSNGTTTKRCGCRHPDTGKPLGSKCPKLRRRTGWNPSHGIWQYQIELPPAPEAAAARSAAMASPPKPTPQTHCGKSARPSRCARPATPRTSSASATSSNRRQRPTARTERGLDPVRDGQRPQLDQPVGDLGGAGHPHFRADDLEHPPVKALDDGGEVRAGGGGEHVEEGVAARLQPCLVGRYPPLQP